MADNKKAAGEGEPQAASKSVSTNNSTTENRFAMLASRVLAVLKNAGIEGDQFVSLRITVTDKDGGLLKYGVISEWNDLHRGPYE